MKALSECADDRCFLVQLGALVAVCVLVFCLAFSVPLILATLAAVVTGASFWGGELDVVGLWLVSSVRCALVCAIILGVLVGFVRFYLRAKFGRPGYSVGLQMDLSRDELLRVCQSYIGRKCVGESLLVDQVRGRMVAVISETAHGVTYLEVEAYSLDENITWVTARSATRLCGHAALFSSFNIDFGRARQSADRMVEVLLPYASKRKAPTKWSRSAASTSPSPFATEAPPIGSGRRLQGRSVGISNQNVLPMPTSLVTPIVPL